MIEILPALFDDPQEPGNAQEQRQTQVEGEELLLHMGHVGHVGLP